MFATSTLVGTPVVAAPARAARPARSTRVVAAAAKKAPPKKKAAGKKGEFDFWEWFNNAACRDSGVIGAGYEDALKNGQFKGKKKK
ncbi:uncharacterized protein MICPUCDRAFT_60156 [Micromonas pusilla CCMP1545]|uniref:Predicted protein n=1 Tax=Micromonas pusilla (strain CCMP1545) TaxID=564608 RepID=C1MXH0_MICPC|nr:uncharacterized protein MICPUCDRAFT_60156 [Micromonas pusilla CCMP1545]EEH55461.1 predicted protein [Micromonas pusilla CCMP1545]|eukprot:XP_003060692.1 predicted protein [Micromonas pusilla CCMP1545]